MKVVKRLQVSLEITLAILKEDVVVPSCHLLRTVELHNVRPPYLLQEIHL